MPTAKPSMADQVLELHCQRYGDDFAVLVQDAHLAPPVLGASDQAAEDSRAAGDCAGVLSVRGIIAKGCINPCVDPADKYPSRICMAR